MAPSRARLLLVEDEPTISVAMARLLDRWGFDTVPACSGAEASAILAQTGVDLVVIDCSFISLRKLLPPAIALLRPSGRIVALIKPQFEAGREEVGKGGVVRDPAVHERVCADVASWIEVQGWHVAGVTPSPITGPEGNVEFLLGAVKNG